MTTHHALTAVAKAQVPAYADDDLRAKAHAVGCQTAEYLRDIIFMDLYGQTFGEHVANDRRSVMGCKTQKQAVESTDK